MRFETKEKEARKTEKREEIFLIGDDDKILGKAEIVRKRGKTHVESIGTSPQKQGSGTKLMEKIMSDVDRRGDSATVDAAGVYGRTTKSLVRFYRKFGFKKDGRKQADGKVQPMKRDSQDIFVLSDEEAEKEAEEMAKRREEND